MTAILFPHDERPASRVSGSEAPAGISGTRIGGFMILRKLGEGGMGVVYAAYDARLDRNIALKILHAKRSNDASLARFAREAKGLAQISHPNVVQIHGVGPHDDGMYIAMEYIAGLTLQRWLEPEQPWRAILDVLIQAGRGLAAAHEAKLVHRDFKPGNVMVAQDGRVRVLDFGLVRSVTESDEEPITQVGSQPGTPAYMAPEQIEGREVDTQTDQFAFCMVAFEALYGERPFGSGSLTSRANRMMSGRIHPRPARTKVPRRIHAAVVRGLAADPKRRWPSMASLLAELEGSRALRARTWLAVTLTAFVVTSGASLVGAQIESNHDDERRENQRQLRHAKNNDEFAKREQKKEQAKTRATKATLLAELPGQRSDALRTAIELFCDAWPHEGKVPLELETAVHATTEGLHSGWEHTAHAGAILDLAVVPDGERFVTLGQDHYVTIWDPGGQAHEFDAQTSPIRTIEVSPDGAYLLTTSADAKAVLWLVDTQQPVRTFNDVDVAGFAPTGELVIGEANTLQRASGPRRELRFFAISTMAGSVPESKFALPLGDRAAALAFDHAGTRMIAIERSGEARLFELPSGRQIANVSDPQVDVGTLTLSADGQRIAAADRSGAIHLWDGLGRALATIPTNHGRIDQLSFAPLGYRLVSVGQSGAPNLWDALQGQLVAPIQGHRLPATEAVFAPNGRTIATLGEDSVVQISDAESGWSIDTLEGRPSVERGHLRFSSDGGELAVAGGEGWIRVWTIESVAETRLVESRGHEVYAMALASDGKRTVMGERGLASLSDSSSNQSPIELDHGDAKVWAVAFSLDNQKVATADDQGHVRVWNAKTGNPITSLDGGRSSVVCSVAFAPDGKLATGDIRGHVQLWALDQGKVVEEWDVDATHTTHDPVTSLDFASASPRLAASTSHHVVVRSLEAQASPTFIYTEATETDLSTVALSPDGKLLAFAGRGREFDPNLHEVRAGVQIRRIEDEGKVVNLVSADWRINDLAFSPDGKRLASAGDLRVRLWDLVHAKQVAEFNRHAANALTLDFSDDGRALYSGSATGEVLRVEATAQRRIELACGALKLLRAYQLVAVSCDQVAER